MSQPRNKTKGSKAAGSNAERTRRHNRQVVLSHIRASGKLGRADVAREAGLSVQAVSNIIASLKHEGLLMEAGTRQVGRGLPAPQYSLNPTGAHALGFEVRPDVISAALINLAGAPLQTRRVSLVSQQPGDVAAQLADLKQELLQDCALGHETLMGAGIVMPGPLIPTGLAHTSSVLPAWEANDVTQCFSDALALDTLIENDANAAAVAERVCGCAHHLQDFAFIYFGNGLGLGVVSNGQLFRGSTGNAGELGHIPVYSATHHKLVPLESIASRLALQQRLRSVGRQADSSDALATLFAAEEPVMLKWLDDAAAALSQAVQVLENLLDPESVILGGALPNTVLNALIERMELSDQSIAYREERQHARILQGSSGGNTAALGAASLVINATFTPHLGALMQSA